MHVKKKVIEVWKKKKELWNFLLDLLNFGSNQKPLTNG